MCDEPAGSSYSSSRCGGIFTLFTQFLPIICLTFTGRSEIIIAVDSPPRRPWSFPPAHAFEISAFSSVVVSQCDTDYVDVCNQ